MGTALYIMHPLSLMFTHLGPTGYSLHYGMIRPDDRPSLQFPSPEFGHHQLARAAPRQADIGNRKGGRTGIGAMAVFNLRMPIHKTTIHLFRIIVTLSTFLVSLAMQPESRDSHPDIALGKRIPYL